MATLREYTEAMPGKRMGAAVLLTDETGRVLLVEPVYKPTWEIPGGAVEADESPREAARREVAEELGLEVVPGRLLVMDWVSPQPDWTEGLMVIFAGPVLPAAQTASIRLPPEELRSWAWCTAEQSETCLTGMLGRRVAAARDALRTGTTAYLEDGFFAAT